MLLLTRKVGESIRIGDDIVVQIMKVKGGYVSVGIEAPRSTNILRTEVFKREQIANSEDFGNVE